MIPKFKPGDTVVFPQEPGVTGKIIDIISEKKAVIIQWSDYEGVDEEDAEWLDRACFVIQDPNELLKEIL